ncbi:hypothetical protein DSL72_006959 [Monilinia vaccinii-corymbosi]|uniref:Uncharacterized protein n=1 Tax=Monilinia vaccinii-corymbosi TaxID=61207 RepID=A0A8A3PKA7_9HELO|nr:hypothetical protein DSL72_006959 [Monilinia vaccinii-corymbosi]
MQHIWMTTPTTMSWPMKLEIDVVAMLSRSGIVFYQLLDRCLLRPGIRWHGQQIRGENSLYNSICLDSPPVRKRKSLQMRASVRCLGESAVMDSISKPENE